MGGVEFIGPVGLLFEEEFAMLGYPVAAQGQRKSPVRALGSVPLTSMSAECHVAEMGSIVEKDPRLHKKRAGRGRHTEDVSSIQESVIEGAVKRPGDPFLECVRAPSRGVCVLLKN